MKLKILSDGCGGILCINCAFAKSGCLRYPNGTYGFEIEDE